MSKFKPQFGSQINWGHPLTNGLIACWLMNEYSGDTVNDIAGNNHGTPVTAGYMSWSGFGVDLNPLGNGLNAGTGGSVNDFTIVARVNLDTVASARMLLSRANDIVNDGGWEFGVYDGDLAGAYYDTAVRGWYRTVAHVSANETINIAMVRDSVSGNVHFYADDFSETKSATTGTINNVSTDTLLIGDQPDNQPMDGEIIHLYLYDAVMSETEVRSLFADPYQICEPLIIPFKATTGSTILPTYFNGKIVIKDTTTKLFDGLVKVKNTAVKLLDGKAVIKSSASDLYDGKIQIGDSATNLLDGKVIIKNVASALFDGKVAVKDVASNLLDGKTVIKTATTNLLDGKTIIKTTGTDNLDGKVIVDSAGSATDLLDGKVKVKSVATDYLDGLIIISDTTTNLLDGKTIIKSSGTLNLDGKVKVKDIATNLLDGKAVIKTDAANLVDGKIIVSTTAAGLLDGKAIIKDASTVLLDGKIVLESDSATNILDGKIIIQSLASGKVTISFVMTTPAIGFSITQPSIDFDITTPTITFDME